MKKTSIICAAIHFALSFPLFSQDITVLRDPSSWPFYPLQLGNFWRYQISRFGGIWGYNLETIVDSLSIEGKWYWQKQIQEYTGGKGYDYLRQEDTTYIISRDLGQYSPISHDYKIDAVDGDIWLVHISPDDSMSKVWGKLDSTSRIEFFGKARSSKQYRFWQEINGRLQWTKFETLVEGLGLIRIRGGDGGVSFHEVDLVGAIIDGKEYGDPSSISEAAQSTHVPKDFLVNYPNPFATATTIEIDLHGLTLEHAAQISVYNSTGQRIRTIYDGIMPRDRRFRTKWDGRNDFAQQVSSGVYFVQIRAGNLVQTKRTLFLK